MADSTTDDVPDAERAAAWYRLRSCAAASFDRTSIDSSSGHFIQSRRTLVPSSFFMNTFAVEDRRS